jgi:hypothetical protein
MSQTVEVRPALRCSAARTEGAAAACPDGLPGTNPHTKRRRHIIELLTVSAVGLVPWTVLLGLTLPSDYRVHAWRTTWVGFDVLLLVTFATTAFLAWRRNRAVIIPAAATGVLLICDAWFDVSLDFGTPGVWMSAALAVFAELPLAGFMLHRAYSLLRLQLAYYEPRDEA